jgi:carboxyl-terminal processing protease
MPRYRNIGLPRFSACLVLATLLDWTVALWPTREARAEPQAGRAAAFGELFDAVVDRTAKSFWDKDRLVAVGWEKRAAETRQSVMEAPDLDEAARRINLMLADLKTSHTALLTPDDVDYYVFGSVFGRQLAAAGIGIFSARIDGRDFVDLVLEGSAAHRAGFKVGDEIVAVDGAPYHPVRSFRGKAGRDAAIALRRVPAGPVETIPVAVSDIRPLQAFKEATLASARVMEREGRRIGYVHVWASVTESPDTLAAALINFHSPRNSYGQAGAVTSDRTKELHEGKKERLELAVPPWHIDGLVIDMRGKIGGFFSAATRYLEVIDRRGPDVRMRSGAGALPGTQTLRGRTVLLIDHHTRSAAETFVHAYKREWQGPLIGSPTAGAVSGAGLYDMPGDNLLYLAVTGLEIDGDVLEQGQGVAPDIEVARPLPYANGTDLVLDAGVAYLARKAAARASASASSN